MTATEGCSPENDTGAIHFFAVARKIDCGLPVFKLFVDVQQLSWFSFFLPCLPAEFHDCLFHVRGIVERCIVRVDETLECRRLIGKLVKLAPRHFFAVSLSPNATEFLGNPRAHTVLKEADIADSALVAYARVHGLLGCNRFRDQLSHE